MEQALTDDQMYKVYLANCKELAVEPLSREFFQGAVDIARGKNLTPVDAGQGDTPPLQIGKFEQLTTVSSHDAFTNAAIAKGVKVTVAPVITPERLEAMQSELDTLRAENAKLRKLITQAAMIFNESSEDCPFCGSSILDPHLDSCIMPDFITVMDEQQ